MSSIVIVVHRLLDDGQGWTIVHNDGNSAKPTLVTVRPAHAIGYRAAPRLRVRPGVMGEVKTDEKSNEIKAIPKLLELLGDEIADCVVTIDAAGCPRDEGISVVLNAAR